MHRISVTRMGGQVVTRYKHMLSALEKELLYGWRDSLKIPGGGSNMKSKLLALALMVGGSALAGPRVFVGVGIGGGPAYLPPPPPRVYYQPPAPGPGFGWVSGYYYPAGPRWAWRPGHWAARPYPGAVWFGPRYYRGRYFPGYWRR